MNVAIVIPARYASKRFPGKPLANILGISLLERMWLIAKNVKNVDTVIIATDDERIAEHATVFGAKVQMTNSQWLNGSERILEALELQNISPDIVVNLQGDAVLTPPFVIESLVAAFLLDKKTEYGVATPCVQLTKKQYMQMLENKKSGIASGTLVTFDKFGKALYFSRSLIPLLRDDQTSEHNLVPVFRHIGLYAYRLAVLKQYVQMSPTPLELAEGLEQLRLIENGLAVKIIAVDYKGRSHWSIDEPTDITVVEDIIKKEGELVKITA